MKRRAQRLAKVLIVLVAIALLAYVTLDVIYFHVLFSGENAVVVPTIQSLIVIVGILLLLFIQRREEPMQPS